MGFEGKKSKVRPCLLSACCFSKCFFAQENNQRRMSDPTGELEKRLENIKIRPITKSRSENQVLQDDDNGINEIEAIDFTKGNKIVSLMLFVCIP